MEFEIRILDFIDSLIQALSTPRGAVSECDLRHVTLRRGCEVVSGLLVEECSSLGVAPQFIIRSCSPSLFMCFRCNILNSKDVCL